MPCLPGTHYASIFFLFYQAVIQLAACPPQARRGEVGALLHEELPLPLCLLRHGDLLQRCPIQQGANVRKNWRKKTGNIVVSICSAKKETLKSNLKALAGYCLSSGEK